MSRLRKCNECGTYTISDERCPRCGGTVSTPHPPKYSPQDRYGEYRRKAKRKADSVD